MHAGASHPRCEPAAVYLHRDEGPSLRRRLRRTQPGFALDSLPIEGKCSTLTPLIGLVSLLSVNACEASSSDPQVATFPLSVAARLLGVPFSTGTLEIAPVGHLEL